MKKTYIFGHRNPDTDSVTSAIALSYLKNRLGMDTEPAVLSGVNLETKYALKYFDVREPKFLNDVKIKVSDLNYTKNYSIRLEDSINDAYVMMEEAEISKIPVVDRDEKLIGIVYDTRTGLPLFLPGFHLGISFTTRNASASRTGSTERAIEARSIRPSFSTTK